MYHDDDLHRLATDQAREARLAREEERHAAALARRDGATAGQLPAQLRGTHPYGAMARVNPWTLGRVRDAKAAGVDVVATPWPTINQMCMMAGGHKGLAHGWHVIVAAASNRGKTQLALNLAVHALRQGEGVCYFALESDMEELATRAMSIATGTPLRRLSRGRDFDIEADLEAARVLCDLPGALYVNTEPVYQVADMERVIEAFHEHYGTRTFVVDHMQLAQAGTEAAIFAKITEVSSVLNTLAKRHGLVSVGLSQLTTAAARNHDSCPTAYDLLGGGPLINDANMILVVDHCAQHWRVDHEQRHTDTLLLLNKNRHGPTGELPVRLLWDTSTVVELAPGDEAWANDFS